MIVESIEVDGVRFPLGDGFEPLPDQTGVTSGALSVMCTHLAEGCRKVAAGFSRENLAAQGLTFIARTNVSVAAVVCDAIRFRQSFGDVEYSKWAVFYPIRDETKLFVVTCLNDVDEIEQLKSVRGLFARVEFDDAIKYSVQQINFDFESQAPFQVCHRHRRQVILSVDGVFPVKAPDDPKISLVEMPMRLLPPQFQPFVAMRLESLKASEPTIQMTQLSTAVIAAQSLVALSETPQALHARYYFLPTFVICAEAFLPRQSEAFLPRQSETYVPRQSETYVAAVQSIFETIRPHGNLR